MANKNGDNGKIVPLGQTAGAYGNTPYTKGRTPPQGTKPLKP